MREKFNFGSVLIFNVHDPQITDRDSDEHFKKFSALVQQLSESQLKSPDGSLEDAIQKMAKNAVQKNEAAEIEEQKKVCGVKSI